MHILLECTWDILQNRSYTGSQIRSPPVQKKTEIIPCIFTDHNAIKLGFSHKKNFGRATNIWRVKYIVLENEWINQEIKEELKIYGTKFK